MNILLIEPYYGGSHRAWADGYRQHSQHNIQILSLPAQFWKWRMQGGAVTLARLYHQMDFQPDVVLASDMMNVATFRALTRQQTVNIPIALYFHENQLTYPQNRRQKHGWRYGFVNYISAMAADAVFFNSAYHRGDFFEMLPKMLNHFADHNELGSVEWLRERSLVLPVGFDLHQFETHQLANPTRNDPPIILWNHRWEADKNPQGFFEALYTLQEENVPFQVVLLGENFVHEPPEFIEARDRLGERILQYGYIEDYAAYVRWLWKADFVVSTAYHDFFGLAMAEAIVCGCIPILPNRLNYPALVPAELHEVCLYGRNRPEFLLKAHLRGDINISVDALRQHIKRYSWDVVAPQYDAALENLIEDFDGASSLSWVD